MKTRVKNPYKKTRPKRPKKRDERYGIQLSFSFLQPAEEETGVFE